MKTTMFILFALTAPVLLIAQEKVKQREAGVIFTGLDNFGFTFRIGKEKCLWRFNSLFLSGSQREADGGSDWQRDSRHIGFGIGIGKEWRSDIAKQLELRYGADLHLEYLYFKDKSEREAVPQYLSVRETREYKPGVNLVLGLNYVIKQQLVIGAEFLPRFQYVTGEEIMIDDRNSSPELKTDITGWSYRANLNAVQLSLAYRFFKEKESGE